MCPAQLTGEDDRNLVAVIAGTIAAIVFIGLLLLLLWKLLLLLQVCYWFSQSKYRIVFSTNELQFYSRCTIWTRYYNSRLQVFLHLILRKIDLDLRALTITHNCSRLKTAVIENKKCCTFKQSRFEKSYSSAFATQNSKYRRSARISFTFNERSKYGC